MVLWEEVTTPSLSPSDSIDPSEENSTSVCDETESTMLKMLSPNENCSWIRAAIPHLPRRLAAFYLVLNIGLPGSGTVLSGWSTLCVGKSRMPNHSLMIIVNTSVGVAQFLTIPWLLVGWFWSITWGIILWLLAEDYEDQDPTTSQTSTPYPSDHSTLNENTHDDSTSASDIKKSSLSSVISIPLTGRNWDEI